MSLKFKDYQICAFMKKMYKLIKKVKTKYKWSTELIFLVQFHENLIELSDSLTKSLVLLS